MFLLAVGKGGSGHCLSSLTFTMSLFLYYRVLTNIPVWHVKCHLILISICIFLMAKPRFFLNHISIYLLNWSIHAKLVDFMEFSVRKTEKKMVINTCANNVCRSICVLQFPHVCLIPVCYFLAWLWEIDLIKTVRRWGKTKHRSTGIKQTVFSGTQGAVEKPQHPLISACFIITVELGGRIIAYSR